MFAAKTKVNPEHDKAKKPARAPAVEPGRSSPEPFSGFVLQRKASCACGGGCPRCAGEAGHGMLQAKPQVSTPGDPYEQEADRIAAQVMRVPDSHTEPGAPIPSRVAPPTVRRKRAACRDQEQRGGDGTFQADALPGAGRPLAESERAFFEPRFGRDFGGVRVHADTRAAELAQSFNARAYTVGRDIVFGAGEYAPGTEEGRRLLAHELTHVVQQDEGRSTGLVQRAEVDDRSCAGLTDIEPDINAEVNRQITAARTAAGSPLVVADFLLDVANRLTGFRPVSLIESFIESLGPTKVFIPPPTLSGTKFSGVAAVNVGYLGQMRGVHVVGGTASVHGICVGADKFGHFFEEGYIYHSGVPWMGGGPPADPAKFGRGLEINLQGLASTGVYSNADLEANRAGLQFYKDLAANPSSLTFAISNYITTMWNEQVNPSFYESDVAGVIWTNLLTGGWEGTFTSGGGRAPARSTVDLSAAITTVTGTYKWPAGAPTPNSGNIKNGVITQKTTTVTGVLPVLGAQSATAVTGISIDYDWEEGAAKGKGRWESVDEQTLEGTWGYGASRTDGGTWTLKRPGTSGVVPPAAPTPAPDKVVNKEGTWLVDDPRHWQEGSHHLATLSKGTPVEVLDEGAGEPFNQALEQFRWWKVRAGGAEGWVMQTLLDDAP